MEGSIITLNGKVKSVNLTCTPIEYLTIITALQHYSEINMTDVQIADRLCEEAIELSEVKL